MPTRAIDPPLPRPEDMPLWRPMTNAAMDFWSIVSGDRKFSDEFRSIALDNHHRIQDFTSSL